MFQFAGTVGKLVSLTGVADTYPNLPCNDVSFHQLQTPVEYHFRHNHPCFVIAVIPGQDLREGYGMALALIVFDIGDQTALSSPGMIDQKLCIDSEGLVQHILREGCNSTHGIDSETLQPCSRASCDLPEVCNRSMIPKGLSV